MTVVEFDYHPAQIARGGTGQKEGSMSERSHFAVGYLVGAIILILVIGTVVAAWLKPNIYEPAQETPQILREEPARRGPLQDSDAWGR